MDNLKDYKKAKYPFEEYLNWVHAKDYQGTDDDMPDSLEDFITEMEHDDLIMYSNAFSKMLLDLVPEKQPEEKCKECSTYRKVANNGERYLCNHFSEHCSLCERWAKSGCCRGDGWHFDDCPKLFKN